MAQTLQPQDFSTRGKTLQKPAVSVIMPVYNVGSDVRKIADIAEVLHRQLGNDFELIVVDDGSTDNTSQAAKTIQDDRIKITGFPSNRGKGAALTHGYRQALGDVVIFADGDLQAFPRDIQSYVESLKTNDIAIASKRISGSLVEACVKRKFLSIGFNLLVRSLVSLQMSDTQVGFKVFTRNALEHILPLLSVKRYAFDVELLTVAKLLRLKVTEMPAKVILESNFRKKNMLRMFVDLLGITYRLRVKSWYQLNILHYQGPYEPLLKW